MKKYIFLLLFICQFLSVSSQTTSNHITGKLVDKLSEEAIEFASVRILNAKDSTYVTGSSTDDTGSFRIAANPRKYIVEFSQMGYIKKYVDIDVKNNFPMGNITLDENSVMLNEAVIEAKAIEIQVKGDTIEYNADSYKVQENAVVEDLLKKMPGVEIDENGKITVNGKEVKKFLVDGKEYFSSDPKIASKNLPAKMVNKLQVVDRKSDMAQMTGFDDGEEETVINLTVKPGMKQGVFGNAFAGTGNRDKYEAQGTVNYMRNNTQVSAVGGINNTNNAGFSDFGSSLSGGRGRMSFGGRNGVSKSINGGINFATEHSNKLKWGGNVNYGNVDNDVSSDGTTEYTKVDNGSDRVADRATSSSKGINKSDNLGADFRFEWTPDSLTKVIFSPSFQYNTNNNIQQSADTTLFVNPIYDQSTISKNLTDGKSTKLNGNLEISRKLNDKGRTISLGFSGGFNNSNTDGLDYTEIKYANKADSIINLRYDEDGKSYNWRMFLSYVEPLGRNNFLELSYNIRNNNSETDKKSYDNDPSGNGDLDEKNTRYVKNDFINQNVSLKFRASREKYNYMLGLGLEPSSTKTTLYRPGEIEVDMPRKNFLSFAPSAQFNYLWNKTTNMRIDYSGTTNQPSTLQLYDGVYSRNGANTTSGNPDLRPSFNNRLSLRYRKSNPQQGSFMFVMGQFNFTSNDIVTVSNWNNEGGRDSKYENIDGNMNGNIRFMFNRPLRNKKFSINSMTSTGYTINNTYIYENKNKAKTLNLQENLGIRYTSDQLEMGVRGNIQFRNVKNTISGTTDGNTYNYGGSGNLTWYLPFKTGFQLEMGHIPIEFTLESDVTYSTNSGYSAGFKQKEWLWNAAFSINTLKGKSGTIRFKIYDILKERSNISRNISADRIDDTRTNTISNYFMVTFVYKFQIFKGGGSASDIQINRGGRGGRGGGAHMLL